MAKSMETTHNGVHRRTAKRPIVRMTEACARSILVESLPNCENEGISYENSQAMSEGGLDFLLYPRKYLARHL